MLNFDLCFAVINLDDATFDGTIADWEVTTHTLGKIEAPGIGNEAELAAVNLGVLIMGGPPTDLKILAHHICVAKIGRNRHGDPGRFHTNEWLPSPSGPASILVNAVRNLYAAALNNVIEGQGSVAWAHAVVTVDPATGKASGTARPIVYTKVAPPVMVYAVGQSILARDMSPKYATTSSKPAQEERASALAALLAWGSTPSADPKHDQRNGEEEEPEYVGLPTE